MDTILEFNTVQELVMKLLESNIRCRNDDKWLTYRVMRHFTNIYIPFEDFAKMPSYSTVTRVRRVIQNEKQLILKTVLYNNNMEGVVAVPHKL